VFSAGFEASGRISVRETPADRLVKDGAEHDARAPARVISPPLRLEPLEPVTDVRRVEFRE
jgi:hypothetical protein